MTLTLPTNLVDTVGSASASGVEAAGQLLQDVGHAVSNAAASSSKKARRLARSKTHKSSGHAGRTIVVIGGAAALGALAFVARRRADSGRVQATDSMPVVDEASPDESVATKNKAAAKNGSSDEAKNGSSQEAASAQPR